MCGGRPASGNTTARRYTWSVRISVPSGMRPARCSLRTRAEWRERRAACPPPALIAGRERAALNQAGLCCRGRQCHPCHCRRRCRIPFDFPLPVWPTAAESGMFVSAQTLKSMRLKCFLSSLGSLRVRSRSKVRVDFIIPDGKTVLQLTGETKL